MVSFPVQGMKIRRGEIFPQPVCLVAKDKKFMEFPLWEKS